MSLALTVAAMTNAGCNAEQINAVVQAYEAERERAAAEQRAKKTAQKRKERASSPTVAATMGDNGRQDATGGDTLPPKKEIPPTPPKEKITPNPSSLRSESVCAREAFAEFKKIYPKRAGSQPWQPAERKFLAACSSGVEPEAILAGCRAYASSMAGDDPQFVAQAVTWLNQRRWQDEHVPRQARAGPPKDRGWVDAAQRFLAEDFEDGDGKRGEGNTDGNVRLFPAAS